MKISVKPRIFLIAGLIAIAGILSVYGFFEWRSYVKTSQDMRRFNKAKDLLGASRPEEALAMIRSRNRPVADDRRSQWLSIEIKALEKLRKIQRLLYIYDRQHEAFIKHEEASLLIARAMLHSGNLKELDKLRDAWRNRETRPGSWFALDVDTLLVEGKASEALKLLNSRSFEGPSDGIRLTRLALLSANNNLPAAWNHLNRAFSLDSKNSDVRSFRAQILERIGKLSMARVEYVAAHLSDPDNPMLRDQLAEFYRRTGNYGQALTTWSQGLEAPSTDFIWLKTLFWGHVAQPVQVKLDPVKAPSGALQPLVVYLMKMPQDKFWDAEAFQAISTARALLNNRQETFWLRLLQALKEGQESRALDLLYSNSFRQKSWNPDIETALKRVLAYRIWGVFPKSDVKSYDEGSGTVWNCS